MIVVAIVVVADVVVVVVAIVVVVLAVAVGAAVSAVPASWQAGGEGPKEKTSRTRKRGSTLFL